MLGSSSLKAKQGPSVFLYEDIVIIIIQLLWRVL